MRYFKKIIGEHVYLSPINMNDVEIYTKWINDYKVSANLGIYRQMIDLNNEQKILEHLASEGHNFSIVLVNDDTLIGNIGLADIDHINRKATVGLFIGESEKRSKGYGYEALKLILGYGFKTLNLHNIMLQVHSGNKQGIACYNKVGFHEFGRRHEAEFKNGQYIDIVQMEIMDNEFMS